MEQRTSLSLAEQLRRLARDAEAMNDETWHLSRRPLARGTTAFVTGTLHDARTLLEAMKRVARAYNVIHGGDFNHVEQTPDRVTYRIDDTGFPYDSSVSRSDSRATMGLVLVFVHALLSLIVGEDLRSHMAGVTMPADGSEAGQHSWVSGRFWPVRVRAGPCGYRLDYLPGVAHLPTVRSCSGLGQADVLAEAIRMTDAEPGPEPIIGRVRAALARGLDDQSAIARMLGVSVATLRRRLDEAGTSFRDLRVEALGGEARRLLSSGRPIGEVADKLGFADCRSFARAFKSWYGETPGRYRQAHVPSENVPSG